MLPLKRVAFDEIGSTNTSGQTHSHSHTHTHVHAPTHAHARTLTTAHTYHSLTTVARWAKEHMSELDRAALTMVTADTAALLESILLRLPSVLLVLQLPCRGRQVTAEHQTAGRGQKDRKCPPPPPLPAPPHSPSCNAANRCQGASLRHVAHVLL